MDELIWTEWLRLPPLPSPRVGTDSEPQVDFTETKMAVTGASQDHPAHNRKKSLRKIIVTHLDDGASPGHLLWSLLEGLHSYLLALG